MPDDPNLSAWIVREAGTLGAVRYQVRGDLIRIGRSSDNDISLEERSVSSRHLEIKRVAGVYRLYDLHSTNGTYLNGELVVEAALQPPAWIRLGTEGPELAFLLEAATPDPNETLVSGAAPDMIDSPDRSEDRPNLVPHHEKLLSRAVARARLARNTGAFDQTVNIMREMLGEALVRTSRKLRIAIAGLALALAGVSVFASWQIGNLRREKRGLDSKMQNVEALLETMGQDSGEAGQLLAQLDRYQDRAKALESGLLYRLAGGEREDLVSREIRSLMTEFGAETYSIPPEFLDEVKRFIQRYQGPDRRSTQVALGEARPIMESMREIFKHDNLPPDLAYMVVVESGMSANERSPAGAVGWWQFTPVTAKHYGLRVDGQVDDRRNIQKSTQAASRYIRDLILDFGAGSSVMLALAAYNLGPARVKQAVRRVSDPIKQRNFWYLYRTRALPLETREYVPKVVAAMIIARQPERFGF